MFKGLFGNCKCDERIKEIVEAMLDPYGKDISRFEGCIAEDKKRLRSELDRLTQRVIDLEKRDKKEKK